jgi:hypothetical protein
MFVVPARFRRHLAVLTAAAALTGCGSTGSPDAGVAPRTSSPAASPPGTAGANGSTAAGSGAPAAAGGGTAAATGTPTGSAATAPAAGGAPPAQPAAAPELPRGGRQLFPAYRLVGYSGRPGVEALGRLGIGSLDARIRELEKRAAPYALDRKILPVMELIATIAAESPGEGGLYRSRAADAMIEEHVEAARKHKALLLIGIQPGRADFLPEVKAYAKWLKEPHVGVALDPEWAVGSGQVPGEVFGRTTGRELDGVAKYLAKVVADNNLPEKVMVVHQLSVRIIDDESKWKRHRGVVGIKSVDGIGSRAMKLDTNRVLTRNLRHVRPGFKLFYEEDVRHGPLMTPKQVMAIRPRPDYVLYE